MPATTSDTARIRKNLKAFAFADLFNELGWDRYDTEWPVLEADGHRFRLTGVAEKRGMVVVECAPVDGGKIPPYAARKKIETQVTKRAFEHILIFTDGNRTEQIWQFARREHGQTVKVREFPLHQNQSGQDLVQRLASLAISLDDEDTLTLQDVIRLAESQLNVETVTRAFYREFDRKKNAFTRAIEGIGNQEHRHWYASVMLNRLMFIYFVQRKGFLDSDRDYLRTKLAECRDRLGQNQFHNFYRGFLLVLFHDGLNRCPEEHSKELVALIGKVPYLNGGIFDIHKIEADYGDAINIPDDAFEKLFDFFDGYRWHLDERPIVEGNEINPDVLGYIFEKYINQKQMGAYYTKEDITEYISKNTIIPHLFDKVARASSLRSPKSRKQDACPTLSYAFDLLKEDPDRYIYDAIKHGWAVNIHETDDNGQPVPLDRPHELPADIVAGLENPDQWDLIERRKCWNRPAPPEVALPTEIWREVVHRRQRYFELREKLEKGEVTEISDLITLNLNITVFARDAIDRCPDKYTLAAFWKALTEMSVLDPTCGSGAFLFAALNILEPLYDAALNRMDGLLHDLESEGKKPHPDSHEKRFKEILAEVEKHPNRTYFVLKSIVVQNLYGVDIMEEAVEICKLRLFLKLAAQVDPEPSKKNFGIEPLPDIDFNIKAGNTLVGFATESEVRRVLTQEGDQMKMLMDDELFGYERVETKLREMDSLYHTFCQSQLDGDDEGRAKVKAAIRDELREVTAVLDDALAREYGVNPENEKKFAAWKTSHQPFHWFCEFFGIMKDGGFDVIIGNPPYVEYTKVRRHYTINSSYKTKDCGNIYAPILERSIDIANGNGHFSMIVPLTLTCTARTKALRNLVSIYQRHVVSFDMRPSSLFEGVAQRLSIISACKRSVEGSTFYSGGYKRWQSVERDFLIPQIKFIKVHEVGEHLYSPKLQCAEEAGLFAKLDGPMIKNQVRQSGVRPLYVHRIIRYFIKALNFIPLFIGTDGKKGKSEDYKVYYFDSDESYRFATCLLNSSFFYWFWRISGDGFHCGYNDVYRMPLAKNSIISQREFYLAEKLMNHLKGNSIRKEISAKSGRITYEEFKPSHSKPIIDEIDKALAPHYGFTPEELDFIINYDIKYRMGLNHLAGEEESEG